MDRVCKPKDLDGSSSSDARVSASEDADEDVFQWPTKTTTTSSTITITVPQNGVRSATDAAAAALPLPPGVWTAVFDYEASADDELSLRRGDVVEVLSKDSLVSGDEGWWTGMIADRVGIFPSNYVSTGKVIAEEIRDSAEHLPVPPPLHREYLHCVFLMQLFKKKRSTHLSFVWRPEEPGAETLAVSWQEMLACSRYHSTSCSASGPLFITSHLHVQHTL